MPYTISFVSRKRIQIDNLNQLPKEKRPPDPLIWDGSQEEIEDFLDRVFDHKKKRAPEQFELMIDNVEG